MVFYGPIIEIIINEKRGAFHYGLMHRTIFFSFCNCSILLRIVTSIGLLVLLSDNFRITLTMSMKEYLSISNEIEQHSVTNICGLKGFLLCKENELPIYILRFLLASSLDGSNKMKTPLNLHC